MAGIGAPTTRGAVASNGGLHGGGGGTTTGSLGYTGAPTAGIGGGMGYSNVGLQPTNVALQPTSVGNFGGPTHYMSTPTPSSSSSSSSLNSSLGNSISSLLGSFSSSQGSSPASTYTPGTFSVQAQENPQLNSLINETGGIRQNMAAGLDQDAQLAMQRQRDAISGMASEFGSEAASRGIVGSGAAQEDLLKRVVNPGQQQLGQLNANLASDARDKQLAALGQQAGLVNQQAQLTQNQQQFGLQSWQAQQQAQQQAAQLAVMQQQNGLSNLSSVVGLIGSLGNLYSGF